MKVAFHLAPTERGTAIATFDYAHFNEQLLGNQSVIIAPERAMEDPSCERFRDRFTVRYYGSDSEISALLESIQADAYYQLIHGRQSMGHPRPITASDCRELMHCVFSTKDACGDVYAAISPYLNRKCGTDCPVVPHMIHLPEVDGDLRQELNIPADATVFGRYGGKDTFSIQFAQQAVADLVQRESNLYFLFMNTDAFCEPHPQIIHLPASFDLERKARFINTCDAMLHARRDGETFGIAVGEFSMRNKPILTFAPPTAGLKRLKYLCRQSYNSMTKTGQRLPKRTATEHLRILGERAFVYSNKSELKALLLQFDRNAAAEQSWDAYSEHYSPEPVMKRFQQIFLASEVT